MTDGCDRNIEYLRLSVTERCGQKCTYCSKSGGGECIKESELRCEDFVLIAKACAQLGFKKIRITGGEPLLRRDLTDIIAGISGLGAYRDIALTTNAQMLSRQAPALKAAGLMRCNVSLDSLNPDTYRRITGGELQPVLDGIEAAYRCALLPIKINCVPIKGVNDRETDSFLALAREYPVDVRFIELMPMGDGGEGVSSADILAGFPHLFPCKRDKPSEPAVYYAGEDFRGRVGFISPMSHSFCGECDRIRITSDGTLRPCLGANLEFPLQKAIKSGDIDRLKGEIAAAIAQKPQKNLFEGGFNPSRKMNRIGG